VTGRVKRFKCKWESGVSPKYTDGGIKYSDECKMMHKTWREAGIVHFNKLCAMVQRDITMNPQVVIEQLLIWWSQMDPSKRHKRAKMLWMVPWLDTTCGLRMSMNPLMCHRSVKMRTWAKYPYKMIDCEDYNG
jgi:hypothetical protein